MGLFLQSAWLIPLLPLLGFAIITLLPAPLRNNKLLCGWLAVALMAVAMVVAIGVGVEVAQGVHVAPDGTAAVVQAGAGQAAGEAFQFPEANIVQTFRW